MIALAARRTLGATARSAVLAVVAPCAALAQPLSPPSGDAALAAIVQQIDEAQSQRGMNSVDLIEPLAALSSWYEQRGADELAIAAIERSRQVIHVNYGLHTLDELPLMKQLIRIEEARGNAELAWNHEQVLLARVRRHPHDARTAQTLREIADKRMAMLARYRAGEYPPQIVLGCYYGAWQSDGLSLHRPGCRSGSKRMVIGAIRAEAASYRREAANIAYWRARWADGPCATPPTPAVPDRGLSKREAKSLAAQRLNELSDYVACTQVKHEHARSVNAPVEDLALLAARHSAAAQEMQQGIAVYEQRFGPIRAPSCLGRALRRPGSASHEAPVC